MGEAGKDNQMTEKIDPYKDYKIGEIATPAKINPDGKGLLNMSYHTVMRRVKSGALPARKEKVGSKTLYYIRGKDLIDYIGQDEVTISTNSKQDGQED